MKDISRIPYRQGEPAPSPKHILAKLANKDGSELGTYWILPSEIQDGPIRHREIDHLLPMVRWTWRHLGKYLAEKFKTFEEFEQSFLRDTHPEREAVMWVMMTYATLEFTERHPEAKREQIFDAVLSLSLGGEVRPKAFADDLKQLLNNPPKILADVGNFTSYGHLKTEDRVMWHLR